MLGHGFHPLKAHQAGQFALADLSTLGGALHQGGTYRRIEVITGSPRRRRWSAEEKARILAESFQPGTRVSDVAFRHGVNRGLVWSWRRQVSKREAQAEPAFVPIRIAEVAAAPTSPAALERHEVPAVAARTEASTAGSIDIELGNVRVCVRGTVDTAALRAVLSHLGRAR